jgi:hypothetical protein
VATEAARPNGNNLEKEEIKKEREKKRKRLTLTGLLMEGMWITCEWPSIAQNLHL